MKKNLLFATLSLLLASCGSNTVSSSEEIKEPFDLSSYTVAPDAIDFKDRIPLTESVGTVEDYSYSYNGNTKIAKVYLPANYSTGENFDTLYLLHPFNENESTYINEINVVGLLDYLIYTNQINPLIVVMPTWNINGVSPIEEKIFKEFPTELADIVSKVDNDYKTYKGIDARKHRICGGFSMGGITTWSVFVHYFYLFENYINMSGYLWEISKQTSPNIDKKNLALIEETINNADNKSFNLYNYTGSKDFVTPYLEALLKKCSESEYFDFTSNVTYEVLDGAEHNTKYSDIYLVDALKTIYKK